ncbi:glutathione S-transferase A4-like isoform X1 [Diceros bicornis minor]|uniref:glutathione S-transferase A4-like isoform X1 n=1 Tax=Diceros bicornis minor TaxID=77932 RepID=UPI0026EAB2C9|nr:glutathione S-transferase A4-like isoform X1 [Diceros bicornis minor]
MAAANVPVPGGVSPLAEMHSEPIRNPEPGVMAAKPKLYYFRGRGRMEPIRWLLAAAGVEFEEEFLETRERYEKLQKDGHLLFGQVPLVEIDGMMLTQTTAILSYLAAKEGPEGESQILKDHGEDFLVGNKFSWADIQLLEAVLMVEELSASVLSDFPLLKAFKTRISNIPTIKKFLQAGSQRKPPPDSHYVEAVKTVLQFSWQRQSEQTIVSRSKVFEKSKTITPSTANAD